MRRVTASATELVIVERRASLVALVFFAAALVSTVQLLRPANYPQDMPAAEIAVFEARRHRPVAPLLFNLVVGFAFLGFRWSSRVRADAVEVTVGLGAGAFVVPIRRFSRRLAGAPVVNVRRVWRGPLVIEVGDGAGHEVVACGYVFHAVVERLGVRIRSHLATRADGPTVG